MQILIILLNVVGPVFLVALVGYVWARSGKPLDSAFVALIVNTIATPCLVVDTLMRTAPTLPVLGELAAASAVSLGLCLVFGWVMLRGMGLSVTAFLPAMTWSNGGNMGLPLCLFAFGDKGLALAISYFTVSSLTNHTLGQGISAGGMHYKEVLRMPILWAIVLALVLVATGTQLPTVFSRAISLIAGIAVPLMLLSLGYSVANLKVSSLRKSLVLSFARLLGGFAIGWFVAWLFGLEGIARGVIVIQSAMPSAVLNYLFAARYGNQPEEVAGVVVLTTVFSVGLLPFFLWTVM